MTLGKNTKLTVTVATAMAAMAFVWHSACVFSDMQNDISTVKEAVVPIPQIQQDIAVIKASIMAKPVSSIEYVAPTR
jgi:hypothetical protein